MRPAARRDGSHAGQPQQGMVEKMPAIMTEAPTLFVVGAGHLPGDNGVLNLLKQQGYTIEAMK